MKGLCLFNVTLAFPFPWQATVARDVGEDQNAEEGQRSLSEISRWVGWSEESKTASHTCLVSCQDGWQAGLSWDCHMGHFTFRWPLQHGSLKMVSEQGRNCTAFSEENHTAPLPPYSAGCPVVSKVRPRSEWGESGPASPWEESRN